MLFERVKPVDQILESAETRGLKRQLGAFDLTMLGIGAVIGTGIFVLTSVAADKAGPGMMFSFLIAGFVCALAALVYSEIAAIVPVAGSAYTYSYAVFGELAAWMVGWALILEYAIAAAAVAVGWSGYINGFLNEIGYGLPVALTAGPADTIAGADGTPSAGGFNLLAFLVSLFVTVLLVMGTTKSARFTAVLVVIKIIALTAFIILALPAVNSVNFQPMLPNGWGTPLSGVGILGAAASIFFAYVGFDAVSTAAEETSNPNRNVPIGLIASLTICTLIYLVVAYAAVGAVGAQPGGDLSLSKEPLAFVLREVGYPTIGNWVASAAIVALPSVVLMMLYGQTRVLFTMSHDGLMPSIFSHVHKRFHTPHIVTLVTGTAVALFAAMFPVGMLADISNSGTLFAFFMVALGVMVLRRRAPDLHRPFKTPMLWMVGPLAMGGCGLLFVSLGWETIRLFLAWAGTGLIIYFAYARKHSHLGKQQAN
ncbi:amino acid/polyamine/organocation transporter, APC superfamily [Nitrosospira multiformis ATCC 25196]|uniref:Amino acid/polyamine/organocation transporter, APC superfamily n=1 Tax=Nitrosospira multiformis (strain ATCC 25196 / NCIMB 11849 / C 71) TaxID=323848 RepID=Q2Y9L6_NITMU|nr:amino acid permease [Nitrosospira multiformis]ABB74555.1 amino acid/polyamine/organocation transporter, APC superfamily [Nitrosospira multiformis ATCC 25196]SEF94431.1 amino acid/polyamine/organocation transporter, APC superfamily [Nitrosospira multiformis ATCC 25196]